MKLFLPILIAAVLCPPAFGAARPAEVTVIAEGAATLGADAAASEQEAVWDAKRCAVEQAAGLFLRARTVGNAFSVEQDVIRSSSNGLITHWEIVPESRIVQTLGGSQIMRLKVKANVALQPVVTRLEEIRSLFEDMERPRIRVDANGSPNSSRAAELAAAFLKQQGFEVVEGFTAEVTAQVHSTAVRTVASGDEKAPFDLGSVVSASRTRLTLTMRSNVSEETLSVREVTAGGFSFNGDAEASERATEAAVKQICVVGAAGFVPELLARWVEEREEGYAVSLTVAGTNKPAADRLCERLADMRGYRRTLGVRVTGHEATVTFRTILPLTLLRERLGAPLPQGGNLQLSEGRGPLLTGVLRADSP